MPKKDKVWFKDEKLFIIPLDKYAVKMGIRKEELRIMLMKRIERKNAKKKTD